ncbi:DNA ligase C [Actinomadura sp. RB99]|nr:DNA ligase C [Actinomadura sp. RB99]
MGGMDLPISPPLPPMLAKAVKTMPQGDLLYEPKWDGFRCIVFRDGDEVELSSRGEKPLTRYFPEVVEAVKRELPERCVVDGEIVVPRGTRLDFDTLQQRIHPAASRIKLLSEETPASFIAFDLLALGDESLMETPLGERRRRLVETLAGAKAPIHVTPASDSYELALRWFEEFEGAGLDGVIAKPRDTEYQPDKRVLFKVKHERTCDCVVAGFRWHKSGPIVGSLLLGLYNSEGNLQHVGVAASFTMKRRAELVEELQPYRMEDLAGHPWAEWARQDEATADRMPGAVSRWTGKKDLSWVALRPELVVEVAYEAMEGSRFRHTARFRNWRPDRTPRSCTYEQLEVPVAYDLDDILSGPATSPRADR